MVTSAHPLDTFFGATEYIHPTLALILGHRRDVQDCLGDRVLANLAAHGPALALRTA